MKPVIRFPDIDLIHHCLAQHQAAMSLCWHDGALPADEIRVIIGGDHGGGSFEFSFQLANVESLNAEGIPLQSEPRMHQQLAKEVLFELSAEMLPLANKGGTVKMKPVIRFPDIDLIHHCLAQHQAAMSLCWHNGALPADEIWVKIGGDHGGGSIEFSFQLANVESLNAEGIPLQSEPRMHQQLSKEVLFELSAKMLPLANKGGTV